MQYDALYTYDRKFPRCEIHGQGAKILIFFNAFSTEKEYIM